MKYIKVTLLTLVIVLGGMFWTQTAQAAATDLFGWAWSPNIGWISFNSANPFSGGGNYIVRLNDATGDLTGYAWSSNVGWIKFDPSATGCPSGSCGAKVAITGPAGERGPVTGWARVCSGTIAGDCTGPSRTDGWDGWISLSDQKFYKSLPGGNAGVYYATSTGDILGYSWGSEVLGWTRFFVSTSAPDDPTFDITCEEPSFLPGTNRPKWTATATGVDPGTGSPATFTYTWSWTRTGVANPTTPDVYISTAAMPSNTTWGGPLLTVKNNATNDTLVKRCPSATRTGDGTGLRVSCTAIASKRVGNDYYPVWEAAATNAIGSISKDDWILPSGAPYTGREDTGLTFVSNTKIPPNSVFQGPTVTVEDDSGATASATCDDASSVASAIKLKLAYTPIDDISLGRSNLKVKKNSPAFSQIEYSEIIENSCLYSQGAASVVPSLTPGNPDQLKKRSLDTSHVGTYVMFATCNKTSNPAETVTSAPATLEVTNDAFFEEI